MSRKAPEGTCYICGQYGPLSFEHVPPRAAFNNRPVIVLSWDKSLSLGPDEVARGKTQQRGMGGYTLCARCNNCTGDWYASNFVDWCYQGMEILGLAKGRPTLIYPHYIAPLRVLKQIVTMFFSVNGDRFRSVNEELVRFVLNREARYLSPTYRFFVYYNVVGRPRTFGGTGVLDITTGKTIVMSEITYPPFGYVMTQDSEPPDERLVEITHFARYGYNTFATLQAQLPILPTYVSVPGDYREKDQIYREAGMSVPSLTA